jgi:hypothetical protein
MIFLETLTVKDNGFVMVLTANIHSGGSMKAFLASITHAKSGGLL